MPESPNDGQPPEKKGSLTFVEGPLENGGESEIIVGLGPNLSKRWAEAEKRRKAESEQ
jgi:hypothetical protein